MSQALSQSVFFGIALSFLGYQAGILINRRFRFALFNPLLLGIAFVIAFLVIFKIDYEHYINGAKYITYWLTPTTVSLAIPLYRQIDQLRQNAWAIGVGVLAGVLASLLSIYGMSWLFGLSHEYYVTLLPKSITSAIGMDLSAELGGNPAITVATIIITGVFGNMIAVFACKLFRLSDPVARGIAIGTSAHAAGTAKALEMGEVEGAMSSLAIVVAGLLTVILASFFAPLI